jgi:soluble lytic murein transglycosylase-like protein
MIQAIDTNNYYENAGDKSAKLAKAAMEFERMFAEMMVKEMRKSVGSGGLIEKSTGEQIFTEMLDSEYTKMMVKNGNFGLAKTIIEQMSETDDEINPLTALGALKAQSNYARANRFDAIKLKSFDNESMIFDGGKNYKIQTAVSYELFSPQVKYWDKIIDRASREYGVDKALIAAVIDAESSGNPKAKSKAGASGLMQLMPATAKDMEVKNVFNPFENVMGGTKYLKQMLNRFGGDLKLALAAYNAGPSKVEKYGDVPPFRETQNYVAKITKKIAQKSISTGGENG